MAYNGWLCVVQDFETISSLFESSQNFGFIFISPSKPKVLAGIISCLHFRFAHLPALH
jgi:hypothetical protein